MKTFWKGVLQNALGGVLAGLILLFIGKLWAEQRFTHMMDEIRGGFTHIAAIQQQVDQLGQKLEQATHPAKPEPAEKGTKSK